MWHMPGHTYSKLNRFADAAYQQEASARVDHAHMVRARLLPDQIHNYAHNNEWLIRNLIHLGRVRDAIDLAKNMIELPRHPKYNQLGKSGSARFGSERLIDVLVRYELWGDLITLTGGPYLEPTDSPQDKGRRLWAVGLAHLAKRQLDAGRAILDELSQLAEQQKATRDEEAADAEAKAREEKKVEEEIAKAREDASKAAEKRVEQIEKWIRELDAVQAVMAGDAEKARDALVKLTEISQDRLAIYYSWANDLKKGVELAREAQEKAINQVQPLACYVDLLERSGKQVEAAEQFERLRGLASYADLDVPVMRRLAPLAERLGLPADWRHPPAVADDIGERPELASLGPFRWHPATALDWHLHDAAGESHQLEEYLGRPVVVIFYLGYGCLHCVEQLKQFAPAAERFGAAGISLIGISTDAAEDLIRSVIDYGAEFPFPLVSDSELNTFKAYQCYDDFEQTPLHGTFLIDGQGLVRWQDIGHEPFTDVEFLLREADRLLALP
jgi:peroxiredoxin